MIILGFVFFTTLFLSALISIIGTIITLVPKRGVQRTRRDAVSDDRQRIILSWLAGSDLLACVGIIIFAIFCMAELRAYLSPTNSEPSSVTKSIFCVIFTAWVQFFYLATYFWSFFYALDVYLMLRGVKRKFLFYIYLCVTWLTPAIIIVSSLLSIYSGRDRGTLECSPKFSKQHNKGFIWGSYSTLIVVFVSMPIFYFLSARQISPMLKRSGVYTDRERRVKTMIQRKFMKIVIVFIVCWAPNIFNIIILVIQLSQKETMWRKFLPIYAPTWLFMALLNPMQTFFNSLVYWGCAGCTKVQTSADSSHFDEDNNLAYQDGSAPTSLNATGTGEQTPLLRSMMM